MTDVDLLAKMGIDASTWVDEYMARFSDELPDEGNLLGWFANAIEAGAARNQRAAGSDDTELIDIVFDGSPGHVAGRFVEVEDQDGRGVSVGEWVERGNGYWVLRITAVGVTR